MIIFYADVIKLILFKQEPFTFFTVSDFSTFFTSVSTAYFQPFLKGVLQIKLAFLSKITSDLSFSFSVSMCTNKRKYRKLFKPDTRKSLDFCASPGLSSWVYLQSEVHMGSWERHSVASLGSLESLHVHLHIIYCASPCKAMLKGQWQFNSVFRIILLRS